MKTIFTTISIFLTIASLKSQAFPVEEMWRIFEDRERPTNLIESYPIGIADVNGVYNKYLGYWQGLFNNNTILIKITKYDYESNSLINPERRLELLRLTYKITDSNGLVLANNLSGVNSINSPKVVELGYMKEDGSYFFEDYIGNGNCYDEGHITVKVEEANPNQLQLFAEWRIVEGVLPSYCTERTPLLFPTEITTFTKQ